MIDSIKLALRAIWADCVDTYKRCKILIFAILALVGFLEFNKIRSALLTYLGEKEINTNKKVDQTLASTESSENTKADALVKDAEELPKSEPTVTDDDWNKKQ